MYDAAMKGEEVGGKKEEKSTVDNRWMENIESWGFYSKIGKEQIHWDYWILIEVLIEWLSTDHFAN